MSENRPTRRRDIDIDFISTLAEAVIRQTIRDWRYLCDKSPDPKDDDLQCNMLYQGRTSFRNLIAFLDSPWCGALCGNGARARIKQMLAEERKLACARDSRGKRPPLHLVNGRYMTVKECARAYGLSQWTIYHRMGAGQSLEHAVNTIRARKKIEEAPPDK